MVIQFLLGVGDRCAFWGDCPWGQGGGEASPGLGPNSPPKKNPPPPPPPGSFSYKPRGLNRVCSDIMALPQGHWLRRTAQRRLRGPSVTAPAKAVCMATGLICSGQCTGADAASHKP